jgi:hypothetical protein
MSFPPAPGGQTALLEAVLADPAALAKTVLVHIGGRPLTFPNNSETAKEFPAICPGRPGRLSALSVFRCKSVLCGAFAWARRALNNQKWRFPARAVTAMVPGEEGAAAIASVLTGEAAVSGRLTQTWVRSVGYVHTNSHPHYQFPALTTHDWRGVAPGIASPGR